METEQYDSQGSKLVTDVRAYDDAPKHRGQQLKRGGRARRIKQETQDEGDGETLYDSHGNVLVADLTAYGIQLEETKQESKQESKQGAKQGAKRERKQGRKQRNGEATQQDFEPNAVPNLPKEEAKKEGRQDHQEEVPSKEKATNIPARTVDKESEYFFEIDDTSFGIKKGFVPNMNVEGKVYVNKELRKLLFEELNHQSVGGFLPAVKQVANVASLPGLVGQSIGLPDIHSGYGFAIGNVAAFDMKDPAAVVSPGGVGFDINCGVRLIRTNLLEKDVAPYKEAIAEGLFKAIPVGVGAGGSVNCGKAELDQILNHGVEWAVKEGIAWQEDLEFCEERGKMHSADASKVSSRAKSRGIHELGSLGAGNHYTEMQVVDEIFDKEGAKALGIDRVGQVCIMVHCGSRGLGHQVATDFLQTMNKSTFDQKIKLNDRQLACARLTSKEGQDYLAAMACACNFAWVNRQGITQQIREVFSKTFNKSARDLDMKLIYDVSHNVAKKEKHTVNGKQMDLLVHRKGATRSFGPNHPTLPDPYKNCGQPVFVGGTMGTASYVLLGTDAGMKEAFGSTCHGAGRQLSRHKSRAVLHADDVIANLKSQGISIRIQTPKLVMEEAPETYKDVHQVIDTCVRAGLSKKCVRLRPIAVIKG